MTALTVYHQALRDAILKQDDDRIRHLIQDFFIDDRGAYPRLNGKWPENTWLQQRRIELKRKELGLP